MNNHETREITLQHTQPIKCKCSNETFRQVFFLRKIPALISPTLREEIIRLEAFQCLKCKKIVEFDQKKNGNSQ